MFRELGASNNDTVIRLNRIHSILDVLLSDSVYGESNESSKVIDRVSADTFNRIQGFETPDVNISYVDAQNINEPLTTAQKVAKTIAEVAKQSNNPENAYNELCRYIKVGQNILNRTVLILDLNSSQDLAA